MFIFIKNISIKIILNSPNYITYYRTNTIESTAAEAKHRTTPCKFAISHPVSSLSCGILVTVKSRYSNNGYPDTVKIINIGKLHTENV